MDLQLCFTWNAIAAFSEECVAKLVRKTRYFEMGLPVSSLFW